MHSLPEDRTPKVGDIVGALGRFGIFVVDAVFPEAWQVDIRMATANHYVDRSVPWSTLVYLDDIVPVKHVFDDGVAHLGERKTLWIKETIPPVGELIAAGNAMFSNVKAVRETEDETGKYVVLECTSPRTSPF